MQLIILLLRSEFIPCSIMQILMHTTSIFSVPTHCLLVHVSEIPVPFSHSPMWNHLWTFFCYLFDLGMGFMARLHTGGVMMFLVSWYCMSRTMCAAKININLCRLCSQPDAVCMRLCVLVSGPDPASSPIISVCLCTCWFISTVLFWPSAGCLLFVSSCVNAEAFDHLWQCEYFSSF